VVNRDFPPARIDTAGASMQWVVNAPLIRIPTAGGVTPLAPDKVIRLRLFLHQGFRWGWYYPVEEPDSPVLDLMSVRYLIASGPAVERLRTLPKFRHIASLPGNELFENLGAMPRFFMVHQARPAASVEEAAGLIARHEIDFRRTAITDRAIAVSTAGTSGDAERIRVVEYRPASLELAVESRGTSLLVMSETAYPGWKAWLDGKPTPIYDADLAVRGVVVPDGRHALRMEFRPAILAISIGISLATAMLLITLTLWRKQNGRGFHEKAGRCQGFFCPRPSRKSRGRPTGGPMLPPTDKGPLSLISENSSEGRESVKGAPVVWARLANP